METNQPGTAQAAVGQFVAKFRSEHSVTLDAFARTGRKHGAGWATASVRRIEAGAAPLTLQSLVQIALTIGELQGKPIALRDLFGDAAEIELPILGTAPRAMQREWIEGVLSGEPVRVRRSDIRVRPGEVQTAFIEAERGVADFIDLIPVDYNDLELLETVPEPTLAETRAAGRLDVHPRIVTIWALQLWDKTLDDAAADMAGPGASPQARGRATRELVREIERSIEKQRERHGLGDG